MDSIKFKGQLLCVIGKDANDNMFPISWEIVEIENKESWRWFLTLLIEDISGVEEMGWAFMSNQQKGLVVMFKEIMPNAHHRFCVRHMNNNFKNVGFKRNMYKDLIWNVVKAYRKIEHDYYMNEINKIDVSVTS
uniref:MULE transposase domain-containing protein n=1 Tax=Cajanus cajan TaxID=3821 RepID=A0A151SFR1_CAJCA|nr:hypothetical protein KK1_024248 [Cajanus cajan]